ncbi:TRAP transporter small permease [Pararhodobacter sp. SW119]|uniref:TRAP transporter small permease n=1 Tax=Pararhodobacter sp. SW119 TaxID=2780075 RepID=UPI001AE066D4
MFTGLARAIERVLDVVLIVALTVMVASIFYQVFGRYVLNRTPGWTEETARFLMAWITMLGSAAIVRHGGHIAVTVLIDSLPGRLCEAFLWLRDTIIITMAGALVWYGYGFALIGDRRLSPALEISMYWPFLALPAGGALIALQLLLHRLGELRGEHP